MLSLLTPLAQIFNQISYLASSYYALTVYKDSFKDYSYLYGYDLLSNQTVSAMQIDQIVGKFVYENDVEYISFKTEVEFEDKITVPKHIAVNEVYMKQKVHQLN